MSHGTAPNLRICAAAPLKPIYNKVGGFQNRPPSMLIVLCFMLGSALRVDLGARALAIHQFSSLLTPMVANGAALEANFVLDMVDVFLSHGHNLPEVMNATVIQFLSNRGANTSDQFEVIGIANGLIELLELAGIDAGGLGGGNGSGCGCGNASVIMGRVGGRR